MAHNHHYTSSKPRPAHVSHRDWVLLHRSHDEPGPLPTPCRIWEGGIAGNGYGQIGVNGKGVSTHRLVMAEDLAHDPDLHVLHLCHNPLCVNPRHLYLGTDQDNMNDKVAVDRQNKGETHGQSKLTDKDVLKMRRMYAAGGITQAKLGRKFGISQKQVSCIIRGEQWPHLPLPETLPF